MKLSALPLLALAGLASAAPQPAGTDPTAEEDSSFFQAGTLLPNGSILSDVTMPSYDTDLHLRASLQAKRLILHDHRVHVEAQSLTIDFFAATRERTGTLQLRKANFNPTQQLLESDETFTLISEKLNAVGTGLVYDVKSQRGFINGPVSADALLEKDQTTAMNTSPTFNSLALGAVMVAATAFSQASQAAAPAGSPAHAAAPAAKELTPREMVEQARPTADHLAELSRQAETGRPLIQEASDTAGQQAGQATADALRARNALAEFATHVAMTTLVTAAPLPEGGDDKSVPPPPRTEGPKTHITADDGVFVDREKGIVVFLKNVVVKDEGNLGEMTGADELKIFFKPTEKTDKGKDAKARDAKPATEAKDTPTDTDAKRDLTPEQLQAMKDAKEKAKAAGKDKDSADFGSGMGEVERVIATGRAVVLKQKSTKEGGKDMQASGRMITYDPGTGEVLIKGGSPWVVSDKNTVHVLGENAFIRYNTKTQESVTGGGQLSADMEVKPSDKSKADSKPKAENKPKQAPRGH